MIGSHSYVDLQGGTRWSEQDHLNRVDAEIRSQVTHVDEHALIRRCFGFTFHLLSQLLPEGAERSMLEELGQPLPPKAVTELVSAARIFLEADALATQARIDSAALDLAIDYEQALDALEALPDAPADGADPDAEVRGLLQDVLNSATPETLQLVASRPRHQARMAAAQDPQEPTP